MISVRSSTLKVAGFGLAVLVVLAMVFGLGVFLGGTGQAQPPATTVEPSPPAAVGNATTPQTGPAATEDAVRSEAGAYYVKGRAAYDAQKFEEAIADLTSALELEPDLAQAYLFRGLAYAHNDENALAIEDLETYLDISSDSINAGQIRGLIERLKKPQ